MNWRISLPVAKYLEVVQKDKLFAKAEINSFLSAYLHGGQIERSCFKYIHKLHHTATTCTTLMPHQRPTARWYWSGQCHGHQSSMDWNALELLGSLMPPTTNIITILAKRNVGSISNMRDLEWRDCVYQIGSFSISFDFSFPYLGDHRRFLGWD